MNGPEPPPLESAIAIRAERSDSTPSDSIRRDLVEMYEAMVFIRRFEERCAELYQQGRIHGFLHLYVGEEAVATGVIAALDPNDQIVATYREHAHALLAGVPPWRVMAEMFGRVDGCSGGRGGSMHLFSVEHGLYGGNAIVAGGIPLAVGLALADRMLHRDRVTACFFGDGAMAEGAFHEAINLAALWNLPVLFVCENNLYAMGTVLEHSHAATDLALRAASYGLVAWSVDGMDVVEVHESARQAIDQVRHGHGPVFLECRTYRFRAHSMYDPERYRDRAEVEQWRGRDPLTLLGNALSDMGRLDEEQTAMLWDRVDAAIEAAVERAESSPLEPVEDLLRHVLAEPAEPRR
jgi:pyruvate dehydrogenase E1 component alpha subunit